MKTWDAWFPDVLVYAPTAPDPLVRHAFRRAAQEFFERTRTWMEWLDPVATRAGQSQVYDFDAPRGAQLVRPEMATVGGIELPVSSYREIPRDWLNHPSATRALVTKDLQEFALVGLFAAGEVVQVQVSLKPSDDATGLPDYVAAVRNMKPIAEGAKAILLMTPDTDFFRPDLAAVAQAMFEQGVNAAALEAYQGHTNHVPRARVKWC